MPSSGEEAAGISVASAILKKGIILSGGLNIISPNQSIIYNPFLALNLTFGEPHIELAKRAQGKSVVHLYNQDIATVTSIYPSLSEQREIGEYFKQIDELIAEAEREIARLEKMKLASLQKMFPRPGVTTPEIRFAGFTEEWRSYQLNHMGEWRKGQALSKDDIIIGGKNKCLHYGQLFSEKELIYNISTNTDRDSLCLSSGHDLLFPDSDVTPTGLGRCCALTIKDIILGSGINILSIFEDFDPHFCALNITHNKAQIIERVTGTTVKHIQPRNLSEIIISIPHTLAEQKAIGEYFRNLDELISAKRQKLAKLHNIKKACLDKMFVNTSSL